MTAKHKVFISFHHAADEIWKHKLERVGQTSYISRSVDMGDIDPNLKTDTIRQKIREKYLSDSSVTIVLIGEHTWKRKHVDWEIGSSIRHTEQNRRSGLIGFFLPTHPFYKAYELNNNLNLRSHYRDGIYYYQTIPPRLWDNINCGYANYVFWPWTGGQTSVQREVQNAFTRRTQHPLPNNSYPSFVNNRSNDQIGWQN